MSFIGRCLVNMCHKWDGLNNCFHVSLKILDPGIQHVACQTLSSEGEDTKDEDVKGEIPTGAATPGERQFCRISFFFFFFMPVTSSCL